MATGLPYAYYTCFGEKVNVVNPRNPEFWSSNPYVTTEVKGHVWNLTHNARRDYMIYYPVRLFYDMTGLIVNRDLVQPNIYKERNNVHESVILVSDQAGWPSRRGYPHYNALLEELKDYDIWYIRSTTFRDCFGTLNERTLTRFDRIIENPSIPDLIKIMGEVGFYIGYESGYCSLAGAMGVPYVCLTASVPPINVAHNSCIYALDICSGYCCAEKCDKMCLQSAPNKNEDIIGEITKAFIEKYDGGWGD